MDQNYSEFHILGIVSTMGEAMPLYSNEHTGPPPLKIVYMLCSYINHTVFSVYILEESIFIFDICTFIRYSLNYKNTVENGQK